MTFSLTKQQAQIISLQLSKHYQGFSIQKFFHRQIKQLISDEQTTFISQQEKERFQLIKKYKGFKSLLGRKSHSHKLQTQKLESFRSNKLLEQNQQDLAQLYLNLKEKETTKGLKKLAKILHELQGDRQQNLYFLYDVNYLKLGLPSYRKIVQEPISLDSMSGKLKDYSYKSFQEAEMDFNKIVYNSILFNDNNQNMKRATLRFQRNYLRKTIYRHFSVKAYYSKQIYEQVDIDQQLSKWEQLQIKKQVFLQEINDSVFGDYLEESQSVTSKKTQKLSKQNPKKKIKKREIKKLKLKTYYQKDIKDLASRIKSIFNEKNNPNTIQYIQNIKKILKTSLLDGLSLSNASHEQLRQIQQKTYEMECKNKISGSIVKQSKQVIKPIQKNIRKDDSQSFSISDSDS